MTAPGRRGAALVGVAVILGGPMGCATAASTLQPAPSRVQWKAGVSPVTPFSRDALGRIVLEGAVDRRPATIHLDSGAVGTIVSEALIDPASARRIDTAVWNHQTLVERWSAVRIEFGPLSIEPDVVAAANRTGRTDVLIGNAVFEEAVVEIDYEARDVTFLPPSGFAPPPGATALPLSRDGGRVTARVSLNGEPPICVGVDTGFNGSLSLAPSVVESRRLKTNPAIEVTHHTAGRDPVRSPGLERIERVTVAGFELRNVSASPGGYTDTPCGSLLGAEVLSGFHLYFDLSRDTLWLTPRADLSPRFETVMGITYRDTPTGMLVTAISQGSPALGVVQIGDRITRIDGDPPAFTLSTGEVRRPPQSAAPTAPPEGEHLGDSDLPPLGGVRP